MTVDWALKHESVHRKVSGCLGLRQVVGRETDCYKYTVSSHGDKNVLNGLWWWPRDSGNILTPLNCTLRGSFIVKDFYLNKAGGKEDATPARLCLQVPSTMGKGREKPKPSSTAGKKENKRKKEKRVTGSKKPSGRKSLKVGR